MGDLDDGPDQRPLEENEAENAIWQFINSFEARKLIKINETINESTGSI